MDLFWIAVIVVLIALTRAIVSLCDRAKDQP
jgi:hypothetical protein